MELLTPLETLCRLILRAKELEAQVPAADPDEDPEDVDDLDDEGDQALSALEDELNTAVEEEVQALLDDLARQLAETVALLGRPRHIQASGGTSRSEASDLNDDSGRRADGMPRLLPPEAGSRLRL